MDLIEREDRIDRYVLGQMTDDERNEFENEMRHDECLRRDVRLTAQIVAYFKNKDSHPPDSRISEVN